MKTISVKALRPIHMTAKTLVFEDSNHETYIATRRVANDILSGAVDEVTVVIPPAKPEAKFYYKMLATPSCW